MENEVVFESLDDAVNYISANSSLTTTESAALAGGIFGMFAGVFTTILIVGCILYILLVIAQWRMFTKAGEAGWKAIIPIYNAYIFCKIVGLSFWKWFAILFVTSLFSSFTTSIEWLNTIAYIVEGIALIWFAVVVAKNTAKAFGKGTGFAVGLFFLPNIFQLILGFGSAEYQGAPEE